MKLKLQINGYGISVKADSNEAMERADNLAWFPDHTKHCSLEKESGFPISTELVEPLKTFAKLNGIEDSYTVEDFNGRGAKNDRPLVVIGLRAQDVINFLMYLADGDQVGVWFNSGVEVDTLTRSATTRLIKTLMEYTTNVTFKGRSIGQ